ncbi:MAG: amino acid permease [candidate division KSB1 bacterium]|nr:amino acid permease [candidate division KSB1 bacterium]
MAGKNKTKNGPTRVKKFNTFGGVFTPDVLTILGVIMYLRLGWVVGNAGFLGAVAIIVLAKSITLCTALSMSSMTTNIRIGAGGAFSIISRSLGLEAGASIGIPLYIAQTLSSALYIIGFTEAWRSIFPSHPYLSTAIIAWAGLMLISAFSAHVAVKIQYIIMTLIGLSLISFFASPASPTDVMMVGKFQDAGFWQVFAIYFPAVTGIMAGANMSGDLKNPKKAIPLGTLSAIGVTMVIYLVIAYVATLIASSAELRSNQMIMVDKAFWGPAVLAGIIGATLSSALGSMVGAPRILQALATYKTVPFHKLFARKSKRNEPLNASLLSGTIILAALLVGSLDILAGLITMFFLITYGMLNFVVFAQQSMKIISFRPTFKIPRLVSLIGGLGCVFIMFLINPVFSIIAIIIILALYVYLERLGLKAHWGDIRSGMFLTLAERASQIARRYPRHQITWKPDLLVPIDDPGIWAGPLLFIRNITYPSGSLFAFTVKQKDIKETQAELEKLLDPIKQENILVNSTVIDDQEFIHGAKVVIQTLQASMFKPNTLFLTMGGNERKDQTIRELFQHAHQYGMGVVILLQHSRMAFGMQKDINLWLRDKSPNWHLALLLTLHLQINWNGNINLVTVSKSKANHQTLYRFLERLSDAARLPGITRLHVLHGPFKSTLESAPRADINIFGLGESPDFTRMREFVEETESSCLFVQDSGHENALA